MMKRNLFAFTAILALFVLSLTLVSAVIPTVSSVSIISNAGADNTYITGNVVQARATFDQSVNVSGGIPFIVLNIGGTNRNASYVSGSGTVNLVFSYTIVAADTDTNGISITANSISLNGATIRNAALEDANLSHALVVDQTSHKVNVPVATFNFCSAGNVGTLRISDFQVNNFGEGDDEEWEPLDRLELEVEVENIDASNDVSDVVVDIVIHDSSGNDVTNDFDVTDESIDIGRIRDDESEIVLFEIPEVPADLDEGNYRIYFKAYSEDEEDLHCVDDSSDFNNDQYHQIEFVRSEDVAVVVRDIDETITASCGEQNVLVSFPVYNIGTEEEDKVLVVVSNKELGIEESVVVENLREGKKKDVDFFLNFPNDASRETYQLDIVTYFDYDEDDEELETSSYDANSADDLDENYQLRVELLGCTGTAPTIGATLDSEAKVGQELIIRTNVKNNGVSSGDFVVSVTGTSGWSEVVSITPQSLSIGSGLSQESVIRINPTEAGAQTFLIEVRSDGESYTQPVSVTIAEKSGGIFGGLENNVLYYVIGALVVLILVFIIMIIRVSRRPEAD